MISGDETSNLRIYPFFSSIPSAVQHTLCTTWDAYWSAHSDSSMAATGSADSYDEKRWSQYKSKLDEQRHSAAEQCASNLDRCSGTTFVAAHIQQVAKLQQQLSALQGASSSSVASSSQLSSSSSGLTIETLRAMVEAAPLSSCRSSPAECLKLNGYTLVPSTDRSRSFAARATAWLASPDMDVDRIAGDVDQFSLLKSAAYNNRGPKGESSMFEEFAAIVDELRQMLSLPNDCLHLVGPAILRAAPGHGHQPLHYDSKDAAFSIGRYSIILYCTNTTSTSMPRYPHGALPLRAAVGETDEALEVRAEQMRKFAFLLVPSFYHSCDVTAGEIMVFEQSVIHHGVRNPSVDKPRILFFNILSNMTTLQDPLQGEYSFYIHLYFEECYGVESGAYIGALIDCCSMINPLEKISDQRDRRQTLRKCLEVLDAARGTIVAANNACKGKK